MGLHGRGCRLSTPGTCLAARVVIPLIFVALLPLLAAFVPESMR